MSLQQIPESSAKSYETQQALTAVALRAGRRAWANVDPSDISASWLEQSVPLADVLSRLQSEAALDGAKSVPAALADQGFEVEPAYAVKPRAVAGFAGAGFDPVAAFEAAPIATKQRISAGVEPSAALLSGGAMLSSLLTTAMADAGRQGQMLAIHSRPKVGWVRMLTPPSCSRCALLAGRASGRTAFPRHPGCDCRAIPGLEGWEQDLTMNTGEYFESLPTAADLADQFPGMTVAERRKAGHVSQEDIFTVNGARAIRDGADPGQVVNARRGMYQVQTPGSFKWMATVEGITKRGRGSRAMRAGGLGEMRKYPGHTRRRMTAQRLMPETIYQVARDQEDVLRLLKLYGYV